MECLHQLMIHMATVATATSRVSTRVVGAVKKKTEERKKEKESQSLDTGGMDNTRCALRFN